jgi:hypothetical protein
MFASIERYRDRVIVDRIMPATRWRRERETSTT